MRYIALISFILVASTSWAEGNKPSGMQPLFDNPTFDMTYPHVSGDYLVYSQRINHRDQIIQLKRQDLYGTTKHISPNSDKEFIRNGIALDHGEMAYVSNRLGNFSTWLSQEHKNTLLASAVFQGSLLPNHLEVSADAKTWVFDSSLESTRQARIANQYADGYLHSQLLGQAWRMYHEKFWVYKSSYPQSKAGLHNKFQQPYIFTFERYSNELNVLGDGFDANLSPNSKSMVFVRENNGNFDLWQQNMDSSGLKRLTKSTFADLEPSLSADGKRIVFISNRDAGGDILQTSIYTLEIATGKIVRITQGSHVTDGGPAWLDDNTIIFHSNRDPNTPLTNTVDNWRLWTVTLPK